jgi:hypothetical protein
MVASCFWPGVVRCDDAAFPIAAGHSPGSLRPSSSRLVDEVPLGPRLHWHASQTRESERHRAWCFARALCNARTTKSTNVSSGVALRLTIVVRVRKCGRVRVDVAGRRVDGLFFSGIWRSVSRVTANLL